MAYYSAFAVHLIRIHSNILVLGIHVYLYTHILYITYILVVRVGGSILKYPGLVFTVGH